LFWCETNLIWFISSRKGLFNSASSIRDGNLMFSYGNIHPKIVLVCNSRPGEVWHTVAHCEAVEKQLFGTEIACDSPWFGWAQVKSVLRGVVLRKILADSFFNGVQLGYCVASSPEHRRNWPQKEYFLLIWPPSLLRLWWGTFLQRYPSGSTAQRVLQSDYFCLFGGEESLVSLWQPSRESVKLHSGPY
jgi:hypothetical protein